MASARETKVAESAPVDPGPRDGPHPLLARAARLSLLLVLAITALAAVAYAIAALGFDWELYPAEAQNVFFADRLANEGSLYFEWSDRELYFPIYAPGYYLVVAPISLFAGAELWAGRAVSLAGCGFAAVAAGLIARRLGCNRPESLASAIAFVSMPAGPILLFNARPDGLALGLTGAALLAATAWEDGRDNKALAGAAGASVAILLTRQNYAPIVVAIAVGLLLRERRAGVRFTFLTLAGTALAVGLTTLLTDGAFVANSQDFNEVGYSLDSLRSVIDEVTLPYPNPVLVVAGIEAGLALLAWRSARTITWAWLGGALVLFSALKIGAANNYVFPLGYVSSILLGPALMRARQLAGASTAAVASICLALLLLPGAAKAVRQLPDSIRQLSDLNDGYASAVERIEAAPGRTFGDRLDLSLASGNRPGLDAVTHTRLAAAGVWDPRPLAERIRDREFALIQTGFDAHTEERWAPVLIKAIRTTYCQAFSVGVNYPGQGAWLYAPCDPKRHSP